MKARAALLLSQPSEWHVTDVELDEPRAGEVLVEMVAAGLCHSDDHFTTGDAPIARFPFCAGHEGSGVVRKVGDGVYGLAVGDHVVTSFVPGCGLCTWCASGRAYLCGRGRSWASGEQLDDSYRMHVDGVGIGTVGQLGTFADRQVFDQASLIKISSEIPLDIACLVSCAVPTGWGSAINAAGTRPGHVVIVMGIGGVGINAVQGARFAGARSVIAVDPVAFKRDKAKRFGATETFATIAEAADFARSISDGQGADATIITVGIMLPAYLTEALASVSKSGTVVVTSVGDARTVPDVSLNMVELAVFCKRIQGVLYGLESPREQIPRILSLYRDGHLKLDELVTNRYSLDEINKGYADMHSGSNIRGIITF